MKRALMLMDDPTFPPKSSHTATINVPVSPAGLACTIELFLSIEGGATKAATSGPVGFTSTGSAQSISLTVTMPDGGFAYDVFMDVVAGGLLVAAYKAKEQVVVPSVGTPSVVWAGR